jgi:hypothetical protein
MVYYRIVASKKTDTTDLQFQIQQLRLDKLIFAVDAVAVCFAVFLILLSLPIIYAYLPTLPPQTSLVLLGVAVFSVIAALSGNIGRWLKIRKLEQILSSS